MQLSVILVVLGALLAAQAAPHETLGNGAQRALLCGLLVTLLALAARAVALATVASLNDLYGGRRFSSLRFRRLRGLHGLAWWGAMAAIYFGLGWPQIVRENWGLKDSILADDLLILLPAIASLLLSWRALGRVNQAVETRLAANQSRPPQAVGGLAAALTAARHHLAPILLPVLLVLGAQDLVTRFMPTASPAAANLAAVIPLSFLAIVGFPWLLRCLWRTEPLRDGELREQLRAVEQRLGVRTRDILVWHTGQSVCNAAVVGMVPGTRYVLLSDLLLSSLSPQQVAAIYAHELGHVRHRHLLLRLLLVILPFALWQALAVSFPATWSNAATRLAQMGIPAAVQIGLLTLAGAALYGATVFSWYCRLLEQQADLCGCRGTTPADPEPLTSALATLTTLTLGRSEAHKATWLHPAMAQRIALVRHMAAHPADSLRFEKRLRRLAWLLAGLVVALTLWPVFVA